MPNERESRTSGVPATAMEERRDRVIATLAAHFAADRLTLDQLETRLDRVQRAVSPQELETVVADLPALDVAEAESSPKPAPFRRAADPEDVRERQGLVAVMGGVERKGHWVPARKTLVVAFMGGVELDLREARLPAGEIEIAIFTVWGGVEIVVPPDVRLDMNGIAIMGGFEQKQGWVPEPLPGAPTIRITGLALMAGVEVSVRHAGESKRDARIRMKEERKRLRSGGRDRDDDDDRHRYRKKRER